MKLSEFIKSRLQDPKVKEAFQHPGNIDGRRFAAWLIKLESLVNKITDLGSYTPCIRSRFQKMLRHRDGAVSMYLDYTDGKNQERFLKFLVSACGLTGAMPVRHIGG